MRLRPATADDTSWLLALVGEPRIAASLSTLAVEALREALDDPDNAVLVI